MELKATAPAPAAPHATTQAAPTAEEQQLMLPTLIFGLPEVRRLKLELESLDDFMRQAAIRQPGTQPALPRLSRLCEALATDNHLNLLQEIDRKRLQLFLVTVEKSAPPIHISFAADPSSAFTAKIVTWLRASIHPYALLQVGLQPTIAAGCVMRTLNKEFDFSLRQRFLEQEGLLVQAFEAGSPPVTATATAVPQTAEPAPVAAAVPAPELAPLAAEIAPLIATVIDAPPETVEAVTGASAS